MNESPESIRALADTTHAVYEKNGPRFDRERPKGLHERAWLDRFLALVPEGGAILDLGCGAGDPIAKYFLEKGHPVTGLDFSTSMLALARERYPDGEWVLGDMRELELGRTFDGILGWNSFFHLTQEDQRVTLDRIGRHLAPGGALMLTVGPVAGEVAGWVGDDRVYHSSLAPEEYRRILGDLGLEVVDFVFDDPECDQQTVLLARKLAG